MTHRPATDFDSRIFEESPTDLGAIAVAGLVAQNLDTVEDDEIATMILDDGELDGLDEMVPRDEESLITAIRIATAVLRSHSSVHDEAVESLLEGEVITNGMLRDMLTTDVLA